MKQLFCTLVTFLFGLHTLSAQPAATSYSSTPDLVVAHYTPQNITQLGEGHYLVDFGKAYFGTVAIASEIDQKESLTVHLGEKLQAGRIDQKPGGTIRYQRALVPQLIAGEQVLVSLTPDRRNTKPQAIPIPDSIGVIMPFRYCEVENLQVPIQSVSFAQRAVHSNFDEGAAYFSSSDTVLNRIYDLCKHTIKATTFAGYYVDGDRERIPYEADAYINQLSHYAVDDDYGMAKRTNEYFIANPTWPTEWLLHTVMLFYQDFMYTGDLSLLQKHYDDLKVRTLQELARPDGLITSKSPRLDSAFKRKLGFDNPKTNVRDIVDWPPGQKDTGWKLATEAGERDGYDMSVEVNTVVNAFYYHNLALMAAIAQHLGKAADARSFAAKADQVRAVINDKLFDEDRGVYVDGLGATHASLHANMLPLAFGLVPERHQQSVVAFIKTRGMACSVYGAQYLLEGLFMAEEPEYALELMTETTSDRSWWNMIAIGSTMTLEAWDMKYKPNADWNHAWGTAPLNVTVRHLWGITPATPGFGRVRVKPQLAGLASTKVKTPTPHGPIVASYAQEEGKELYTIELPPNMTGTFVLTKGKVHSLNGQKAKGKEVALSAGVNELVVRR
ncbi:alpha-L-rhamnosidase-related protein [Marinoscillum furvescens]|uniref:alpha-L-rhamnosidase n=1 Tax=Marinoscillum furvescens DSM 4134 TaxID=1122208 RepID=A0A3D9KYG5_MARFU|nr:alpha-L-rhamnosidase C-terminal domain-containing protein [Marinoscillum furvescens]RED94641.1 alpha-L-rhamnosidase-like protein [Marinoscillum furvescens DSM 4134]